MDGARQAVTRLRSRATAADIDIEVDAIQAAIDLDISNAAKTGWGQLFRGSDLRRTLTVVGVMSIAQANGEFDSCIATLMPQV